MFGEIQTAWVFLPLILMPISSVLSTSPSMMSSVHTAGASSMVVVVVKCLIVESLSIALVVVVSLTYLNIAMIISICRSSSAKELEDAGNRDPSAVLKLPSDVELVLVRPLMNNFGMFIPSFPAGLRGEDCGDKDAPAGLLFGPRGRGLLALSRQICWVVRQYSRQPRILPWGLPPLRLIASSRPLPACFSQ